MRLVNTAADKQMKTWGMSGLAAGAAKMIGRRKQPDFTKSESRTEKN